MLESRIMPDNHIYSAVLKACAAARDLVAGKEVHACVLASPLKPDIFVHNGLLDMYAKCGSVQDARSMFDTLLERNVVTWTVMIACYAHRGMGEEALDMYHRMCQEGLSPPDSVTFVCLLQACAGVGVGALDEGKQLHAQIEELGLQGDAVLGCSLVNMYAKCGSVEDARAVFDKLPHRSIMTWNAMLAGYAQRGMAQDALILYNKGLLQHQDGLVVADAVTFVCLLQACSSVGVEALHHGKKLHAHIEEQRVDCDVVLGCSLVNMYAKCGSLQDARRVFDTLSKKDVVTWNAMFAGYVQHGMGVEALHLYKSRQRQGFTSPDSVTFVSLLQACASVGVGALPEGRQLHAQIQEQGLQDDAVLGCSLINMYLKCGAGEDARTVFDRLPVRSVASWTTMIAAHVQHGKGAEALHMYRHMQQDGLSVPDSITFVCLLQACASVGVTALSEGKQLHAQVRERGLHHDAGVGCSLVNMYSKCGSVHEARHIFNRLLNKNVVTWTAMIAGYVQQGMGQEALNLYSDVMQQEIVSGLVSPNAVTFASLLQACASVGAGALHQGRQLHALLLEQGLQGDAVLDCSLVNMYAKCGTVEDARNVFDGLPCKTVVTWSAMIAAYIRRGKGAEALALYRSMRDEQQSSGAAVPPNCVTFTTLLQACAIVGTGALCEGKQLHAQIEEQGELLLQQQDGNGDDAGCLASSLLNMYIKCGSLEDARSLFERLLRTKNVVVWTTMIAGYAQQGMCKEALHLYSSMQQEGVSPPDCVTIVCLLQACASVGVGALHVGRQLHAHMDALGLLRHHDVVAGNSLVTMYAKCGSLDDARLAFDKLTLKNVVTWNAMIAGYSQQGLPRDAIDLYRSMQQQEGEDGFPCCPPDHVTFVCLLQACSTLADLPEGRRLHTQIQDNGLLQSDAAAAALVGGALVNMYAKCGSMVESQHVFDSMPGKERPIEAWGALIGGYARQGDSDAVFNALDRMRLECPEQQPNGIILLSVLTVCSHVGLVDKGRRCFESMEAKYGVRPTLDHYTCMMGLLGRAGHLEEALDMAKCIPMPPTSAVWHTLLGSCLKWKNVEIGREAFEVAVSVDRKDAASYVLMANIYASVGMEEEAKEVQARRVRCGAWKKPGQSWWTDVEGVGHAFVAGNKT